MRRLVSLSRSGMEGGLALLFRLFLPLRPAEAEAAEEAGEVAPEGEVEAGGGAHLALGVVEAAGQGGPGPPRVEASRLPAVEAVLVAVVGPEGEGVAGQLPAEGRQLEGAHGGGLAGHTVDVDGAGGPAHGDEEDAPEGGEDDPQVEAELAVEVLARAAERAVHHLLDLEAEGLHASSFSCRCSSNQAASSRMPWSRVRGSQPSWLRAFCPENAQCSPADIAMASRRMRPGRPGMARRTTSPTS